MQMRVMAILVGLCLALTACSQNIEKVSNGERIENAPKIETSANEKPLALPEGSPGGEPEVPPFVKAYFMHQFVKALYSVPGNQQPNPNWKIGRAHV